MNQYSGTALVVKAPGLADRLRECMVNADLGVRALAEKSKVDKGTISAWCRGSQAGVRVATVRKVASKLGTTAEYLLDIPPAQGAAASAETPPDQLGLVRRLAALAPAVEALEDPTIELTQTLAANREKLARLEGVLALMKSLVDEARAAGDE